MNNHIQRTVFVLLFLVISSSHSKLTGGGVHVKACTFHEEVFATVPLNSSCPIHPELESMIPTTSDHSKFEPHNPECFGSHTTVEF